MTPTLEAGAAAAPAPPDAPPSPSSASSPAVTGPAASSPASSGGAPPTRIPKDPAAALAFLRAVPDAARTSYQRTKLRELERWDKRERRKAAAPSSTKAPPAKVAAAEPAEELDDAQRARETGGAWKLALRIVSLLLWPFGYRLESLTDKEVDEDVALLVPLTVRHRWLEVIVRYAALPYLLVERVVTKVRPRAAASSSSASSSPAPATAPAVRRVS